MGAFNRSGTFSDRVRFLAGLKSKIANLKEGALRGMDETWVEGSPAGPGALPASDGQTHTLCTISGFGVKVLFTVNERDWACDATIPAWIPIPQSSIEERFDREFNELQGL